WARGRLLRGRVAQCSALVIVLGGGAVLGACGESETRATTGQDNARTHGATSKREDFPVGARYRRLLTTRVHAEVRGAFAWVVAPDIHKPRLRVLVTSAKARQGAEKIVLDVGAQRFADVAVTSPRFAASEISRILRRLDRTASAKGASSWGPGSMLDR